MENNNVESKKDFAEEFEVILPLKQKNSPWEYEQPLKSRPKVFDENQPAE